MAQWLLNRLIDAKDQPKPRFAFQGTVNWMRALSILVENGSFEDEKIKNHYKAGESKKERGLNSSLICKKIRGFHLILSILKCKSNNAFNADSQKRRGAPLLLAG